MIIRFRAILAIEGWLSSVACAHGLHFALAVLHRPGGISVVTTPPPEHQLLSNSIVQPILFSTACVHLSGCAARLAADAAADLLDMITGASASQQAARARAKTRALREKEQQQRDHDEKAAKQAKQRASDEL